MNQATGLVGAHESTGGVAAGLFTGIPSENEASLTGAPNSGNGHAEEGTKAAHAGTARMAHNYDWLMM